MKNENLFAALRAAFPQDLDAVAVETDAGLNYSWRDLERATAMIANLLAGLNLAEGSRIAVQVEKSVEAMMLYLATLRAGYVFLPLNTAYQSAEIEYFIGNAEPAVVVCSGKNFGWVSKIAFKAGTRHVFTLNDDRTGSLLERAAHCSDRHEIAHQAPDDLAAILYTSGTTGRSKGAMLTHGNLLSNARVLKEYWGWKPGDVLIHALPIFHVHGLFVALHGALLNGSKIIWMAKFDPKFAIQKMAEATVFMGVPTLYVRMLGELSLNRESTKHMRLFVSGSAPLLLETFTAWQERTGHTLSTTGLVNETYLRLAQQHSLHGLGRGEFFNAASAMMRRILVDFARARTREKRGGDSERVSLDDVVEFLSVEEAEELVALDEALERLRAVNPRGADVVNCRFFAGLSLEDTAAALDVSTKTVQRDWLTARAWLRKEVASDLGLLPDE